MRRLVSVVSLFVLGLYLAGQAPAQSKKAAELIKDLDSKNPQVRASAVGELGELADIRLADAKFAEPKLRELQKDPDGNVRKGVLITLGKIEPDKFPDLLITALKTDKDSGVQLTAVQAIQQLGPMAKAASPVMQDLYKALLTEPTKAPPKTTTPPGNPNMPPADPPAVRRAILAALGAVEPDAKARIPFMIDVLKSEKDNGVRLTLVQGLGQQGPAAKDAVSVLVDVQKASLAEASKATAPKGQQPDLDPQNVRREILQTLGRIEPDPKISVPRLIDALKTDKAPGVRQSAVQSLGLIGAPAKEAIPILLDVQAKPLPGDQPGLRRAIIDSIVKIETEPDKQVPLLVEMLKKEKTSAGRLPLVQGIAAIGPPAKAASPAIQDVYKTSPAQAKAPDPDGIRKACVEAIGKIDPEPKTNVPFLVIVLKTDRDTTVKQTAIAALKSIGAPAKEAVPALQDIVKTLAKSTKAEDKTLSQEAEAALKAIQGG